MFGLIKREVHSLAPFLILPAAAVAVFLTLVGSGVAGAYSRDRGHRMCDAEEAMFWLVIVAVPPIAGWLGLIQMGIDKTRKVSAFLATLATTRTRILAARSIVGVIAILAIVLPLAAAHVILQLVYPKFVFGAVSLFTRLFITAFLMSIACYSLGLLLAWRLKIYFAVPLCVLLEAMILSVVLVKGLGPQAYILLVLIAATALMRTWRGFKTSPL